VTAKQAEIVRQPSVKVQEHLKSKSLDERKRLLHELEMTKQKEIELLYRAERAEMIHDGEVALKHLGDFMSAEKRLKHEQEIEDRWLEDQANNVGLSARSVAGEDDAPLANTNNNFMHT